MIFNSLFSPLLSVLPENNRLERIWKLAQVDFKKRYYNDNFGLLWALLNPVFRASIYYFVFTTIFKRHADGIDNYALYLFLGIIIWRTFSESVTKGLKLMYSKLYLIENIQLVKSDLFFSHTISAFLGFTFNFLAFFSLSLIFGSNVTAYLIWLIPLTLTLYLLATGIAMIMGTIYIYIKDIQHILDILLLFGFWSSGIFFQGEKFLEIFPFIYYANPFIGIITNFRRVTMFEQLPIWDLMVLNLLTSIFILYIGKLLIKKFTYKLIEKK